MKLIAFILTFALLAGCGSPKPTWHVEAQVIKYQDGQERIGGEIEFAKATIAFKLVDMATCELTVANVRAGGGPFSQSILTCVETRSPSSRPTSRTVTLLAVRAR